MPNQGSAANCLSYSVLATFHASRIRDVARFELPQPLHSARGRPPRRRPGVPSPQLGLEPVLADTNVHHQGHRQCRGSFHLAAHQRCHHVHFRSWDFEHEFVVHLQQHSGVEPFRQESFVIRTIAILIRSAAEPWMEEFAAVRSPNARMLKLRSRSSGTYRRRLKMVSTYPCSRA